MIDRELQQYVEKEILPLYDTFDAAHKKEHAKEVIKQSLELARYYDVDENIVYAVAAYHDTGLVEGRETHHKVSARIIRADKKLEKWFSPEQINIIADAAEDHRASSKNEPRTIYGKIVAEADRFICSEIIIKRTIQYGLSHYPELDKESNYQRTIEHIKEKYAEGGYMKLWIPESSNRQRLEQLRDLFKNRVLFRQVFDRIYDELV